MSLCRNTMQPPSSVRTEEGGFCRLDGCAPLLYDGSTLERTGVMSMCDWREILALHTAKYPQMQPQDAGKLLYQRHLGPGHLIADPEKALARLTQEWETAGGGECEPTPLSGDYVRVPLGILHSRHELLALHRMMLVSAETAVSGRAALLAELEALAAAATTLQLPFGAAAFSVWLAEYLAQGLPLVRHSEVYRQAYAPAYRVILKALLPYLPLCADIEALLEEKGRVCLAIDGRCGSGKSTLAAHLQTLYPCGMIRMDDFFLPPQLRTAERLAQVGGNVHYERFLEEVAPAMKAGEDVAYRPFDCSAQALAPLRRVPAMPVMICEGTYSLHPALAGLYDLAVFSTCSAETQRVRILQRSGEKLLRRFINEWIPMEEAYFSAFGIAERCQIEICTD